MIKTEIILDSINPVGKRLTTWRLTYPRFLHSEFLTHRVFSRNAASSRAIPLSRMIELVQQNPALPEWWGGEQKGMQSGAEIEGREEALRLWLEASGGACSFAQWLGECGLHKSLCNRLLEPFAHMTIIATACEHENFFGLRAHADALPEFQVLAYSMLRRFIAESQAPQALDWGQWHIPMDPGPCSPVEERLARATARIARVSYLREFNNSTAEDDLALHGRLASAGHWSPFEHCAQAEPELLSFSTFDTEPGDSSLD